MENNANSCYSCGTTFPKTGYFCGKCLSQIKCRSCENILEKDFMGCTNCGTPKVASNNGVSSNLNTFKMHQTLTDRTIEASFSDNIGKEIASVIKETYSNNLRSLPNIDQNHLTENILGVNQSDLFDLETENSINTTISPKLEINDRLPTLMDINTRNLPQTEVEWIVIYSFYASDFGKEIFSRKNILEKHTESKRKNDSFSNNLSRSISLSIKEGYINELTDGFHLHEKGVLKAKEIISRPTGTTTKTNTTKIAAKKAKALNTTLDNKQKKGKPSSSLSYSLIPELNLIPKQKQSLKDYFAKFDAKTNFDYNIIILTYLKNELLVENVGTNHFYTCYKHLGLKVPNIVQSLRDVKTRKGWVETGNSNDITITVAGENYIDHEIGRK